MLKPFQHFVSNSDNCELGWSLMCLSRIGPWQSSPFTLAMSRLGIIKKLKTEKHMDIVKKAINMSSLSACCCAAFMQF